MKTNYYEFFEAVDTLRKAQKQYFRSRSRQDLLIAKQMEMTVDQLIANEHNAREPIIQKHYPMFSDEG